MIASRAQQGARTQLNSALMTALARGQARQLKALLGAQVQRGKAWDHIEVAHVVIVEQREPDEEERRIATRRFVPLKNPRTKDQ